MVTLLTLYVYVIIFSTHSWLIEGSSTISKRQDRVPQSFMFLRMLSICLLRKFWFRLKVSWGCQCLFSCNVILFIILTLGLTEFPITMVHQNFMLRGHSKCHMRMDQQGIMDTPITHTSFAHVHASLSHHNSLRNPS